MPDGKSILAVYRQWPYQHLYIVSENGQSCRQLTHGKRFDFDPVISPDGSMIAFCSSAGLRPHCRARANICLINVDGDGLRQIKTADAQSDVMPEFSHDGAEIVFASSRDGHSSHIFAVNVDGTGLRQLTSQEDCLDAFPRFLLGDERVVFARATWFGHCSPIAASEWHNFDFFAVPRYGGPPSQLSSFNAYRMSNVTWSPNEDYVVCGGTLVVAEDDGHLLAETETDATESVGPLKSPSFSPDGTAILFAMEESCESGRSWYELHIMDIETRHARQITAFRDFFDARDVLIDSARFAPDGTRIIFRMIPNPDSQREESQLWIVDADGTNPRRIEIVSRGA